MKENEKYEMLFPFEKVPPNSRIIIYGAGIMGIDYYTQITITNYCKVIGFVDKNYLKYENTIIPVYAPSDIKNLEYDYIVIAIRIPVAFNEIKNTLLEVGVRKDRIITTLLRKYESVQINKAVMESIDNPSLSYKISNQAVALYIAGGYGDFIIQKRTILELINYIPSCSIDLYVTRYEDFISELYLDVENIRNVILDLGVNYVDNKEFYMLSMRIEACHYIEVNHFNKEYWDNENILFCEKIQLLIKNTKDENETLSTPVFLSEQRRLFKGYNAYSGFNYGGVFEIADKKVNIPITEKGKQVFESLFNSWRTKEYITINCGSGECADSSKVAKSWPVDYYRQLIKLLREKYSELCIVQLGDKDAEILKECSFNILGDSFSVVKCILANSRLHIDIEGGLVHLASQLGTKCVVLFGPTVMEYYGYENNINIRVGDCHNCWGLYTDINKCARGLKEPECMYSIKPELVFEYVRKELEWNE